VVTVTRAPRQSIICPKCSQPGELRIKRVKGGNYAYVYHGHKKPCYLGPVGRGHLPSQVTQDQALLSQATSFQSPLPQPAPGNGYQEGRRSQGSGSPDGQGLWLGPTVEAILERFEHICRVEYDNKERTIREQSRALEKLLRVLGVPCEITRARLVEGLSKLTKGERAHATKAIRKLLKSLGHEDLVRGLRIPKYGARHYKLPTDEELRRFYEALDRPDARLALRLLAETGLRRDEVLKARIGDIDWEHMALIPNRATATKKSGIGFFTPETARMLKEHIAQLPDNRPEAQIFPYESETWLRKAFKRAEAKTGIHVCPQMLRIRFADKMGEADVPDRYVDIMQGRSPQTVLARHYTPAGLKKLRTKWAKAAELPKIAYGRAHGQGLGSLSPILFSSIPYPYFFRASSFR